MDAPTTNPTSKCNTTFACFPIGEVTTATAAQENRALSLNLINSEIRIRGGIIKMNPERTQVRGVDSSVSYVIAPQFHISREAIVGY